MTEVSVQEALVSLACWVGIPVYLLVLIVGFNYHWLKYPSCLEHIIQRKESKYDLRHQHRVSVQRFETYYMKNSISYRGSIVWNLLEPSAVSARDYAKRAKKSHALRNLNFNEESPQMGRPQIDSDFVFY